jgi:hypothetical protein
LARGLVRLPLTLIGRYYSDWETGETPGSERTQRWENFETNVAGASNFPTFHPPQPERDKRSWSERVIHGAEYLVTQPTKIATLPILDGMGTPAWDIMLRRTRTMFDPTRSYEIRELVKAIAEESKTNQQAAQFHVYRWLHPTGDDEDLNPTNAPSGTVIERGAMYFLSHEFMEWSSKDWTNSSGTSTHKLPFEFYGHSMGTIVLNQMFRNQRGIQADRITYLAAACSIDDFRTAMFPYLRWHSNTEVYSLSLHRIRERDEFPIKWPIPIARDLIARGSLLNWIDDLLAKPNSISDRTLGAWENAIRALPDVPPELRPQIHFRECELEPQRAWSSGEGTYEPQAHGDFARSYYWSKDFLWPTTTNQIKLRAN